VIENISVFGKIKSAVEPNEDSYKAKVELRP
jgi:hypothetical protein